MSNRWKRHAAMGLVVWTMGACGGDGADPNDDAPPTETEPPPIEEEGLAVCGDGVVGGDEECDDGNAVREDACANTCRFSVREIAAGVYHNCARLDWGDVKCWGHSEDGQTGFANQNDIGDNEPPSWGAPTIVGGVVRQLAAGFFHTCALLETGAVRCWGWNEFGQLGYGHIDSIGDDETPESAGDVDLGETAVAVTAGAYHTCALLTSGGVKCWGLSEWGRLGYGQADGDTTYNIGDDETPAQVADVPLGGRAVSLWSGGLHNCALLETGERRCWGGNMDGQLGTGSTENIGDDETPAEAATSLAIEEPVSFALGGRHGCVTYADETVRCWGYAETGGLGYASKDAVGDDELPTAVGLVDIGGAVQLLSLGVEHSCAVLTDGAVRCFGPNMDGQLGLGHTDIIGDDEAPASQPVIDMGAAVLWVASGPLHNCALTSHGGVRCWGSNQYGTLGYGHENRIGDDESPASAGDVKLF